MGGVDFRGKCGGSLRLWQRIFPTATIVGVDIDKSCISERDTNVRIIIEEQDKRSLPGKILSAINVEMVDLIIDDASHIPEKTVNSFRNLFPILGSGGIYVIEDNHCSYEDKFGNQREVFERFLFWLISVVDLGIL